MRNPTKVSAPEFSFFPFSLARISMKVWVFLAALALAHVIIGYRMAGRTGLWVGFSIAVIFIVCLYYFAEPPLLRKFKAKKLGGQDPWNLRELSKRYARLAGVVPPDLYLMDHPTAIAFSMGQRPILCVSTALLKKLTPAEIEAVMAHQVCHLQRLNTFAFALSSAIAHSLVGLSTILDLSWPTNWTSKGMRHRPFLTILSPLAGLIIRIAMSDRNYFENDDLAASFLPDRKPLATALYKIESYCQTQPLDILPCTNHLFIVNPEGLRESNWFFVTHPKMESRLKRLVGTYPL